MSAYLDPSSEKVAQAIVPVRPATGSTTAPADGTPVGLMRRTLGAKFPSRRTLGTRLPSRRSDGSNATALFPWS
jgi:hypothetical protein